MVFRLVMLFMQRGGKMLDINREILLVRDKKITVADLKIALENLNIKAGDVLCVHSQIFGLGKPLVDKNEFMGTIIQIFQETIGRTGTLIMPTFSYSFCNKEIYDINNSPSVVGVLTEYFRNMSDVYRTAHPIFSFALWGNRIEEYLDVGPDAFSLDSVYGKMIRDNGKILMFGANKGYTFYYLAEEHVNVGHRYFKNFEGQIKDSNGHTYFTQVPYFVRDLSIISEMNEEKVSKFLLENECQKQIGFAKGTIAVVDCKKTYDMLVKVLRENEKRFL